MDEKKEEKKKSNVNKKKEPKKVKKTRTKKIAKTKTTSGNVKAKGEEGKKTKKEKKKNLKVRKTIKIILLTLLFAGLIAAGVFTGKVYSIMKNAKLDMSNLVIKYENSVALDKDGNVIAELSQEESRRIITLSEMSPYIPKAFVAIEDERFYEHNGIDIKRTLGATVKYALSKIGIGSASYGGSTITQQLVKNLTKEDERSSTRKIKEMARAYYIEKELSSKNQILELYLNLILLGKKAYGVEVASNYYFNKPALDLTLAESAYLAGINTAPNNYDPFVSEEEKPAKMEKINNKVKTVLGKMLETEAISKEEYDAAIEEVNNGIAFSEGKIMSNQYSYHTDAAVEQVIKDLMELHPDWSRDYTTLYVKNSGLTIYTTQDSNIQKTMEEEFTKDKYRRNYTDKTTGEVIYTQAAMVIINHSNGQVVGAVGGLGEKTTSFGLNRATQSVRQTGSSMKPLAVLVPGIDTGTITAASVFDDVPTTFGGGSYPVKNYNYYKGLETVRYSIETSQNIPMVKGLQQIGLKTSMDYLKKLGISTLDDERDSYLGLSLGGLTYGISPLEMAAAYATIANDGVYIEPIFYTKVVDSDGNIILNKEETQETRTVISKAAAYVIKEILTQPVKGGTATGCWISGMSVSAKTGTTDDTDNRWLCGFTPYYAASCWYGYDTPHPISYSGNPASHLWIGVMRPIHKDLPSKYFSSTRPDGVTTATVCKVSGKLATEECKLDPRGDQTYTEYFVRGTVPNETCATHVKVKICNETGLLANEYCKDVTEKVFITRPDWETDKSWERAKDAEYMLTIKDNCTTHVAPVEPEPPEEPEEPEKPNDKPEKPSEKPNENDKPDKNEIGNNTTDGNTTGNTTGNNTVENNVVDNSVGNNTTDNNVANNVTP